MWSRSERSPDGYVFIDIVPENSDAATDEPPLGTLLGRRAKKSRKPGQWRGNAAAVHERDDQLYLGCFPLRSTATRAAFPAISLTPVAPFVIGASNIDGVCGRFTGQTTHPTQFSVYSSPVNIFPVSHPLDFDDFSIAEKLIYNAIIADVITIRALGTS